MKDAMKKTFKDKAFEITVLPGTMHPGFAIHTFDEEQDFREKYWNIEPGDIVFDIGAAYGSYTLSAIVSGASKVFAFEPEAKIYPNLYENIKLNGWSDRCEVIPCGLWNKEDNVDIKTYASHYETQLTAPFYEMKMLDSWMLLCEKIDWMKIDVEGAEEEVIKGGLNLIAKFKPNMIIECHTFLDDHMTDKVKDLISSVANYEFEKVNRDPCDILLCKAK